MVPTLLSVAPVLVSEKLQVSRDDFQNDENRNGNRSFCWTAWMRRLLALLPAGLREAEQFEVRVKKQGVYRCAHTACPAFWSRLSDLCTALLSLSPPSPKCQRTSVQSCQNCSCCYFLPMVWACIQENQKWATGKKKQRTQRLILKSDGNVSTEIKCNGVDNESSSRAILSRNKKKTNSTTNLSTSEWLFPAVQLCYWLKKKTQKKNTHKKSHFYLPLHSLTEALSLRSLFARSVDIDLKNQLNSSGIMKYDI